jgi:hypothetical protein
MLDYGEDVNDVLFIEQELVLQIKGIFT